MRTKILFTYFSFSALKLLLAQYLQHNILRLLFIKPQLTTNFINHVLILYQVKIAVD